MIAERLSIAEFWKNLDLKKAIIASIIIYIPFHIIEEWAFGFASWAYTYWRIPDYTTTKWLLHNAYFIFFLLIGFLLYIAKPEKFLPLGVGIVIWGFMNTMNHLLCSIIFLEYEPGLLTSLLWIPISYRTYKQIMIRKNKGMLIAFSMLSAIGYWGIPMTLFIEIDKLLR